jgi:hypothetical protein
MKFSKGRDLVYRALALVLAGILRSLKHSRKIWKRASPRIRESDSGTWRRLEHSSR